MDSIDKHTVSHEDLTRKIYDIPYVTPYLQKIKCCHYIPIVPRNEMGADTNHVTDQEIETQLWDNEGAFTFKFSLWRYIYMPGSNN